MIQDVDHEPNPAEVCSVRLLALDKSGRNKLAINHLPKIVAMQVKKVTHTLLLILLLLLLLLLANTKDV